jgi:hypothetical protein
MRLERLSITFPEKATKCGWSEQIAYNRETKTKTETNPKKELWVTSTRTKS